MPATAMSRPTPPVPCEALSGFAFSQAMSSFRSFAGDGFPGDDQERRAGDQRDRLEIPFDVERELEDRAGENVRGRAAGPIV